MKRIRRRVRNRIVAMSSTILILLLGFIIVTSINKADNNIQRQLLGIGAEDDITVAYNYGIVANKINLGFHSDSNFATKEYTYDGNIDAGKYTSGWSGKTIATKVNKNLWGKNLQVLTHESTDKETLYKKFGANDMGILNHNMTVEQRLDLDLNQIVENMINHVASESIKLAKKKSDDYEIISNAGTTAEIDISKSSDNVVYVDATDFIRFNDSKVWGEVYRVRDLDVTRRPGQTLVLNFVKYEKEQEEKTEKPTETPEETKAPTPTPKVEKEEETVSGAAAESDIPDTVNAAVKPAKFDESKSNYEIQIREVRFKGENLDKNNEKDLLELAENVIYNLPYASHVYVNEVVGTVVAPQARLKFGGANEYNWDQSTGANCAGWLVCNEVYSNCGEWHYVRRFAFPTPSPTPTPTEVIETSTPSPTPTEISTPTPTPVPTPTPTIEIINTPSPTPEITQSPSPTPNITPTPSPTETPLIVLEEDVPAPPASPSDTTNLEEEDVPLSNFSSPTKPKKKTTTLIEEDVPLSSTVPDTGDTINIGLIIYEMCACFIGIVILIIFKKRNKNNQL